MKLHAFLTALYRLNDGRVLVAAGNVDDIQLASVEVFDPVLMTWSEVAPLSTERQDHSATLLPDGKVLIAGGVKGPFAKTIALQSVELFDPVAGTWNGVGNLNHARFYHSATCLLDGTVLVAGGEGDNGLVSPAESFDPESGHWQVIDSLHVNRHNHTATMLSNGDVLLVGGVLGSVGNYTYLDSVELYDWSTAQWVVTGSLQYKRGLHSACLLSSGLVLVTGGEHSSDVNLKSTELYLPETGTWHSTGELKTSRVRFSLNVLKSGTPIAVGGYNEIGVHSSTELMPLHRAYLRKVPKLK